MESHEELVEELDEIIKELKEDPNNSSAAFRLFEISEFLVRGFLNDFELEHHAEDHQDPLHDEEHDEQPETQNPEEEQQASPPKTLPFAVVNHATASEQPSFTNMKKNVNEWLEPAVEFETKDEAIDFVKENIESGSVLEVDWDSGHAEIIYSIEP